MMVFDRESLTILAINEAAIRHYGHSREEFLAMTIKDIRPPEEASRLSDMLRAGDQGFTGPFIGRHRKKDGTVFDVEVYAQREASGTGTIVLAQIHDVTERKRTEAELRSSEERLRLLANAKQKLAEEKLYLEEELRTEHNFEEIIGESPAFKRILKQVETVAPTDATVLILGETGTGKELIARAIHDLSARRECAFVKLNCAAIPTGLLESELFGHEKGAFTGALAGQIGRLQLAHQGTMFLDEVGDIPLEIQPKLLRALEENEFERLGSTRTISVDVRLIAATNRDLAKMVEDRQFRTDLYYRLKVFPITVPSLRERRQDIPILVRHFIQKYAKRMNKQIGTIPPETMKALLRWHWPGNVRELENSIERAVILTQGAVLRVPLGELNAGPEIGTRGRVTLEAVEREHILQVLRETGGVIGGPHGAAVRLGIPRTTLNGKLRKLGICRKEVVASLGDLTTYSH
jgi:formate hydrogenlyase transcriptional activator